MIYPIVVYGDPVLRKRAKDIEPGTDILTLVQDMFETMYGAHGIGLAAPQIGKGIRLFIVDGTVLEDEQPEMEDFRMAFVNPVILSETGEPWDFKEGCLSIPGFREPVSRAKKVIVRAQNVMGEWFEIEGEELLARAFQHEIDHLNGILFISHLSALKRDLIKRKIKKMIKAGEWD